MEKKRIITAFLAALLSITVAHGLMAMDDGEGVSPLNINNPNSADESPFSPLIMRRNYLQIMKPITTPSKDSFLQEAHRQTWKMKMRKITILFQGQ